MNNKWLATCLDNEYGLNGTLSELYSYQDQSFLLDVGGQNPGKFVVKVMHSGADVSTVEMQTYILQMLSDNPSPEPDFPLTAEVKRTRNGRTHCLGKDASGETHLVWVVTYLDGVLAAAQQPYTAPTLQQLGRSIARLHESLLNVEHAGLHLSSDWKLIDAEWIAEHLPALHQSYPKYGDWMQAAIETFQDSDPEGYGKAAVSRFEAQAIHGDINEHNVLFSRPNIDPASGQTQRVAGLIDFGDAHVAPRVCDVAVAATYFLMNSSNPWLALKSLVAGYHDVLPLCKPERDCLMPLIRMRLVQSLTHSMLRSKESPTDSYVTVSQAPALRLIDQLSAFPDGFATYWVHHSCGDNFLKQKQTRLRTLLQRRPTASVVDTDLAQAEVLDLSPASGHPADPFFGDMPNPLDESSNVEAIIGRYGEPRLVYQSPDFKASAHPASDARTIHAGVDIFMPAGSSVFAPCDGVVHALENRTQKQDYGPVIVLRHNIDNEDFYTLLGHLDSECLTRLAVGKNVSRGDRIAYIGAPPENGDWPPHLHFQWILEDLGWGTDIDGVCHSWSWPVWQQYFPNPAPLLGCADQLVVHVIESNQDLEERRQRRLGGNLALSYSTPVQAVRGWQQYLYDQYGQCYLDVYNNVPHVGHCHPHVVQAVTQQLSTLSTNTRYLHNSILNYSDKLTKRFDDHLEVCFLVNSASEANELALRLARSYTKARDMIVLEDAYHGHTTSLVDISPYKAESRGGQGCPDWVHRVPAVDLYRGKYRYDNAYAGKLYAEDVQHVIDQITHPLCAFICESLPSVGGQLVYPHGYLNDVYTYVRAAGGVCIADEVQTGFGRTGDHFWGFEQQNADPDIVVLGKPIGNGFPLAAVITTRAIAEAFDNGMEFFSTFGGNTVACAAGLAVLEVMDNEQVQSHIKITGDYLKQQLHSQLEDHPLVGDIRGMGLFLGIELVTDKDAQTPAALQATYIKNRLRELSILIGTDGPYDNVLKIRPPAPFNCKDADFFVASLKHVLNDTVLRHTS